MHPDCKYQQHNTHQFDRRAALTQLALNKLLICVCVCLCVSVSMSASLNKPEGAKCLYPFTIHVCMNHLNVGGHGDANWHQQDHDKICPDTVIRSPAVESSHHLDG